jgi:hypothetical protein
LEAIGLVLDDGRKGLRGAEQVVDRHVLTGEGIGVEAETGDRGVVVLRGVLLGAAEHHVLEEVGVARAALLRLVAAAHTHERVISHEAGRIVAHHDDAEAVRQRVHLLREGECLRHQECSGEQDGEVHGSSLAGCLKN